MPDANPNAARMIVTSRIFEAPRALVFDAFTHPDHLARWWGPNGFRTTTSRFEFREGGIWRFVMHGPDGRDYENCITFDEISPPERLVYHHGGDETIEPMCFDTIVTFEDLGGRTRLTTEALFPTPEQRDKIRGDYETGSTQHLERLEEFLQADLFSISRRLAAPRDLVWKMWTEAEHLARWWGPKGFAWLSGSLDLRPGGIFHYGMKSPDGKEMWGRFVFHEIAAPERLSFVNSFSNAEGAITRAPFFADWPLEVFNVLTLTEEDGGTLITLRGAPIHAPENERARYRAQHDSMQYGFNAALTQLEVYLKEVG